MQTDSPASTAPENKRSVQTSTPDQADQFDIILSVLSVLSRVWAGGGVWGGGSGRLAGRLAGLSLDLLVATPDPTPKPVLLYSLYSVTPLCSSMAPPLNGGNVFRAVTVSHRLNGAMMTTTGLLNEEESSEAFTVVWTIGQLCPVRIAAANVVAIDLDNLPRLGTPLPYKSERFYYPKAPLGVIGKHIELEMMSDRARGARGMIEVTFIAEREEALHDLPPGCRRLSRFFTTPQKDPERTYCHVAVDQTIVTLRAATLALASRGVGVYTTDEDFPVDRFLCDRLSRSWPAADGTDRASLKPLRSREYWLPLFVPEPPSRGGEGDTAESAPRCLDAFTPQALGRRVAALALDASDGLVTTASATLELLPDFVRWWARSEFRSCCTPSQRGAAAEMQAYAQQRVSYATAKINDEQCLQLCRAFVAYRDGSLPSLDRQLTRLLFRVGQLHGHSPRQLGAFRADCGEFRGYGNKIRTFHVRGETQGTQVLAPQSVARLRLQSVAALPPPPAATTAATAAASGGVGGRGGAEVVAPAPAAAAASQAQQAQQAPQAPQAPALTWIGINRKRSIRGSARSSRGGKGGGAPGSACSGTAAVAPTPAPPTLPPPSPTVTRAYVPTADAAAFAAPAAPATSSPRSAAPEQQP